MKKILNILILTLFFSILLLIFMIIIKTHDTTVKENIEERIPSNLKNLFISSYTQGIEFNQANNKLNSLLNKKIENIITIDKNKKIETKLNSFYNKINYDNILNLRKELRYFSKLNMSKSNQKKYTYLKNKLKTRENKELPGLRKTFSLYLSNKYKEKYIDVKTIGNRNKTLIMDWYMFASKLKRNEFKNNLMNQLIDFKFDKLILKGTIDNKNYSSTYIVENGG